MKTEIFEIVKLIADSGKILTNGEIYGSVIVLGEGDSVDNYHEITAEEYENILAQESEAEAVD